MNSIKLFIYVAYYVIILQNFLQLFLRHKFIRFQLFLRHAFIRFQLFLRHAFIRFQLFLRHAFNSFDSVILIRTYLRIIFLIFLSFNPNYNSEEKIANASDRINKILRKYNFDRKYMIGMTGVYKVTKDPELKSISNDYKNLYSNERIIRRESSNISVT